MAQLSGRNSLRDIVDNMSAQMHRLYHLGSAKLSRSNLSCINEDKPYTLYEALFGKRLTRCQGEELGSDCPLCFSTQSTLFHKDRQREYFRCMQCALVFVPPCSHLSKADEKSYYELHQNSPLDSGYRVFLERLSRPLLQQLKAASHGLDFGSGPGPTLSLMLEEVGHSVELYDPFYAPDEGVLSRQYDFITSTEVVEHLKEPGHELNRLWSLLKPNGILAIMTKRVIDQTAFAGWHYKNDPTHISFFSEEAFNWLANIWQAKVVFYGADVVFLNKGS